ncbi:hypothetical protein FRC10_004716 [Ceratobasidium sp. 414]|nr:hypothetical protein FRC10_004716 [Ceratobasidium sp. 414]
MSAQFAIDPALAANTPTTAAPSTLTKPAQNPPPPPPSPPKQPGYYSILPALPLLPGWGPFPGPVFAPPGAGLPMPVYMGPPPHPHPPPPGTWPEMTPGPVPAQPPKHAPAHYPAPSPKDAPKPALARVRRADPPPINPAAASSPHYQNPGGCGGVYTPPTRLSTGTSASTSTGTTATSSTSSSSTTTNSDGTTTSHYTNTKSQPTPLTTLTSSGRQFACGQPGCNAAFDRKSDCERHRRTHVKAVAEARPFRCGRIGCEAAFDRKDALMRHERNERTHLVRQTQPGRVKRPTRSTSRSDLDPSSEHSQPRRQSTRKRKSLLPSTADMYASDEDDEDEDEGDLAPSVKRSRSSLGNGTSRTGLDVGPNTTGTNGTATDRTGTRIEDMVVMPEPDEDEDDAPLVIDPRLHGLRADEDYDAPSGGLGVETMQAVEAIQAALQQIEADADAEKGRVVG